MINLLPQENKKQFFREYTMRIAIVALLFMLLVEVGLVVAFAPSYAALQSRTVDGEQKLTQIRANSPKGMGDTQASVSAIKHDIDRLREDNVGIQWSDIFSELVRAKPRGIGISGVSYEILNKVPQMEVVGYAEDRDSLSSFRKALSEDALFERVEFPTSAFLKEKDIDFSMRITVRTPKKP